MQHVAKRVGKKGGDSIDLRLHAIHVQRGGLESIDGVVEFLMKCLETADDGELDQLRSDIRGVLHALQEALDQYQITFVDLPVPLEFFQPGFMTGVEIALGVEKTPEQLCPEISLVVGCRHQTTCPLQSFFAKSKLFLAQLRSPLYSLKIAGTYVRVSFHKTWSSRPWASHIMARRSPPLYAASPPSS